MLRCSLVRCSVRATTASLTVAGSAPPPEEAISETKKQLPRVTWFFTRPVVPS